MIFPGFKALTAGTQVLGDAGNGRKTSAAQRITSTSPKIGLKINTQKCPGNPKKFTMSSNVNAGVRSTPDAHIIRCQWKMELVGCWPIMLASIFTKTMLQDPNTVTVISFTQ